MIKSLQFVAALLDLNILGCLLYVLLIMIGILIEQLYIRMRCRYRGIKQKPGRACVTCDYRHQCGRVWKSEEYRRYICYRGNFPDQAKELLDEIWEEEEAKQSNGKPE